jgi:hypothetical protein
MTLMSDRGPFSPMIAALGLGFRLLQPHHVGTCGADRGERFLDPLLLLAPPPRMLKLITVSRVSAAAGGERQCGGSHHGNRLW